MKSIFDIVQPQKKRNEADKTRWTNLGILLRDDEGKMSIKLNSLPLTNEDGEIWLRVFEKKPFEGAQASPDVGSEKVDPWRSQ